MIRIKNIYYIAYTLIFLQNDGQHISFHMLIPHPLSLRWTWSKNLVISRVNYIVFMNTTEVAAY